ncbi:erythromycin esterase family protein [Pontibacter harenae]|uniref:erythromycin esterase family protein n=1 Tax=Pontibacter harenae TaxID=2894083 RepID=UPI001E48E663|nr:erythromycin esterase family protein [Pontibacter harenae]MCC9167900.1 erythromycin esterase family protein [Pontibacter harenae]
MEKLKGKRIVGLGEATHGTAEFEQLFSRLSKSLILEQGFNVVVLAEANFYDTRALNDYIVHGKGDAETAIRYMRHSPAAFVEEEFRELAEWIRVCNESRPAEERVWMLGVDAMSPRGAAYDALRLCQELNVELPEEVRQYLTELTALPEPMFESFASRITLSSALAKVAVLRQALQQAEYGGKLSDEQRWLLQSTVTLEHAICFLSDHYLHKKWSDRQFRDEAMLANIQWVEKTRPGAKMVVYAHNAHLEKNVGYKLTQSYKARLGKLLHNTYGEDFYAICTEVKSGTYWAGNDDGEVSVPEKTSKIGQVVGTVVDAPIGLLELNATPSLTKYFNSPLTMTFGVLLGSNNSPTGTVNLATAFDALLYVRESTPKLRTKPETELKQFSLNLNLSPELVKSAGKQGKLMVNLNSTLATIGTSLSNEGAFLGLLFVDGQKNVVGYRAVQLTGNSGLLQTFPLPARTENVLLTVSGNNVKDLTIEHLAVNGIDITLEEFKYFGEGYSSTTEKSRLTLKETAKGSS